MCFSNGNTSPLELNCFPNFTVILCSQFYSTQSPINQRELTINGEIILWIHWTILTRHWVYCSCWSWVYFSITSEFQPDCFHIYLILFIGEGGGHTLVPWHAWGCWRSAFGSQSTPSTMWAPGIKLWLPGLTSSVLPAERAILATPDLILKFWIHPKDSVM